MAQELLSHRQWDFPLTHKRLVWTEEITVVEPLT